METDNIFMAYIGCDSPLWKRFEVCADVWGFDVRGRQLGLRRTGKRAGDPDPLLAVQSVPCHRARLTVEIVPVKFPLPPHVDLPDLEVDIDLWCNSREHLGRKQCPVTQLEGARIEMDLIPPDAGFEN